MQPHAADYIPLVTVERIGKIIEYLQSEAGCFDQTTETDGAGEVEKGCNMPPCVYFYAGQAHPTYGDCALAYTPKLEKFHSGSASPFDTGGLFKGAFHPFTTLSSDPKRHQEAIDFIKKSAMPLSDWRGELKSFLQTYFTKDWQHFILRQQPQHPPTTPPNWGDPDLPARFQENFSNPENRTSWFWEIRIHSTVNLATEMIEWISSPAAQNHINDQMTREETKTLLPAQEKILALHSAPTDTFDIKMNQFGGVVG